jgi:hypothetical protein
VFASLRAMARPRERTFVSRLADAGEEAIQRLGGAPGADRLLGAVNTLRERVDDMQKRMRAIATIEKQLASIERRLDKLEGKGTASRSRSTSRKTSSTRKKTT